jgi:phosphate transport system permease protein
MHSFFARGEAQVWVSSGALAAILMITILLLGVVMVNGLGVFWPHALNRVEFEDGTVLLGERIRYENRDQEDEQLQLKIGNREVYGLDFRWVESSAIVGDSYPEDAVGLERREHGNFYGSWSRHEAALEGREFAQDWSGFQGLLVAVQTELADIKKLDKDIRKYSSQLQRARLQRYKQEYAEGITDRSETPTSEGELAAKALLDEVVDTKDERLATLAENTSVFKDATGSEHTILVMDIVRAYRPNEMALTSKMSFYTSRLVELFLGEPRESNTEGGLFPAIFGTVMLVFLMSIFSFPLGVIAGIYLREYAKEGLLVRLVRIGVNNLAGVPSIVYGIFGLGFFVYGIGGSIDHLFFPERLPSPTFGTGGILWASLTLGLLTIPVVIVSTEEALGSTPQGIRQGSLSLGATKFQTLWRVLLPMASPGIMTGFILAMARAAGEVAPLMITGVVKLAPSLPMDSTFPYIHAERKFMHLGFHIYDIGFQSPNVEAAKPMVFVTTLLLILIVLVMSSLAIYLRNYMKKKYTLSGF